MRKSDQLFIAPDPNSQIAKRIDKIRALLPIVSLWAEDVYPGQPIPARWAFNLGLSDGIRAVGVKFFVDSHLVYERSGISTGTNGGDGTGPQTVSLVLSDPTVAIQVYRCIPGQTNLRRLELEILTDSGDTYRARRYISIRREQVDGSWWQWDGNTPVSGRVGWNEPYTLAGRFQNKAHAKLSTLWVQLLEIRWAEAENSSADLFATPPNPCDAGSEIISEQAYHNISPSSTVPASFSRKGDWKWIANVTYIAHGPFSKMFVSAVAFWFSDEYGNNYEYYCSTSVLRFIEVSDTKRSAGISATSAAASAVIALAAAAAALAGIFTAALAPGFAALAAGFYATAAGAGAIAKDPPEPDPNFRDSVTVDPARLPTWPSDHEGLRTTATRELFETALRVFALENARTVTRGRMMGARLFGDDGAFDRHRSGYLWIEREMRDAISVLDASIPKVRAEIEECACFDLRALDSWIERLSHYSPPAELFDAIVATGAPPAEAREMLSLLNDPSITELARANGIFVSPFVAGVKTIARTAETERDSVLAGERIVTPRPASESDADFDPPQRRSPTRRSCT